MVDGLLGLLLEVSYGYETLTEQKRIHIIQ